MSGETVTELEDRARKLSERCGHLERALLAMGWRENDVGNWCRVPEVDAYREPDFGYQRFTVDALAACVTEDRLKEERARHDLAAERETWRRRAFMLACIVKDRERIEHRKALLLEEIHREAGDLNGTLMPTSETGFGS